MYFEMYPSLMVLISVRWLTALQAEGLLKSERETQEWLASIGVWWNRRFCINRIANEGMTSTQRTNKWMWCTKVRKCVEKKLQKRVRKRSIIRKSMESYIIWLWPVVSCNMQCYPPQRGKSYGDALAHVWRKIKVKKTQPRMGMQGKLDRVTRFYLPTDGSYSLSKN